MEKQQQQQQHRQQMLLLTQVPQANHANPPAPPISRAGLNSSMQSRHSGVNSTAPMNSRKQPSVEPASHSLSLSRDLHQSLRAAYGADLYTQPVSRSHLQHQPSAEALTTGSVFGGPSLIDSKSPAPISDKLLWHNDIEFPPPPSFDCDLMNSDHHQRQSQLPRSRSTDHRLHAVASGLRPEPISARVSDAARFLATTTHQPNDGWPSNWHSHHSAGRALGQAYMQRLKPKKCSQESSSGHPASLSRSTMYEARVSRAPHSQASDCAFDVSAQSCSMPRSKSQSSLERCVHPVRSVPVVRNSQVMSCRQAGQVGHQQQRNRSCTLQAQSYNLAGPGAQLHNQGSSGVCICASSSLPPMPAPNSTLAMTNPQAMAVQSSELTRFSQELDKAIENTMFIAQHIDNLDEFESVKENWKYIAMVIDRIFLIVFLVAGFVGSVAIFAMVPWSYYTRHSPIDLHLAHLNALNLTGSDFYHKSCP